MSKLLSYTDEELTDAVIEWAMKQKDPRFDIGFVESMSEEICKRGELTPEKRDSLFSIISKWNINVEEYV